MYKLNLTVLFEVNVHFDFLWSICPPARLELTSYWHHSYPTHPPTHPPINSATQQLYQQLNFEILCGAPVPPHQYELCSALSWILSKVENLARFSLQEQATDRFFNLAQVVSLSLTLPAELIAYSFVFAKLSFTTSIDFEVEIAFVTQSLTLKLISLYLWSHL